MNNEYKIFVNQCKKNRTYLQFSYKDMANALIGTNENDYKNFESFKYKMSKENLIRIARILCIERKLSKNIENYIEIDELDEEELKDISKIVSTIVGDENA